MLFLFFKNFLRGSTRFYQLFLFFSLKTLFWRTTRRKQGTSSRKQTWMRWIASSTCACLVTNRVVRRTFSYFIMDSFTVATRVGAIAFTGAVGFSEMECVALDLSRSTIRLSASRGLTLMTLKKLTRVINMKRRTKS